MTYSTVLPLKSEPVVLLLLLNKPAHARARNRAREHSIATIAHTVALISRHLFWRVTIPKVPPSFCGTEGPVCLCRKANTQSPGRYYRECPQLYRGSPTLTHKRQGCGPKALPSFYRDERWTTPLAASPDERWEYKVHALLGRFLRKIKT